MAKVTIVSVSEDQNTVALSNGLVLKAVEGGECNKCVSPRCALTPCSCSERKDQKKVSFLVDESKCDPLFVVIDGRKFTAENTTDAKWLKELFEKQVEVK